MYVKCGIITRPFRNSTIYKVHVVLGCTELDRGYNPWYAMFLDLDMLMRVCVKYRGLDIIADCLTQRLTFRIGCVHVRVYSVMCLLRTHYTNKTTGIRTFTHHKIR